jgi:hypothetical protein
MALATGFALGQSPGSQGLLQRYLRARQNHSAAGREEAVEVEIDASLPRLQKHGTMRGLKVITRAGRTVYTRLHFSGDRIIGKDVISRYLAADIEKGPDSGELAIVTGNYRFESIGEADYNGRAAQVFRVVPKHRRGGLFRGELWLDEATALPLREWGDFVKSPSHFLSQPRFVRDYSLIENQSRPLRLILTAHASLVGEVQMTIWFGNNSSQDTAEHNLSDLDPVAASNP